MSKPLPASSPPRRGRRFLVGCLGILLITFLFLGGAYVIFRYRVASDLEAALAEARDIDPLLTIEDLEAAREVVPAEENSAPRILAAAALVDEKAISPDLLDQVQQTPPNQRFDPSTAKALTAQLEKAAPALAQLRGLESLPRGRHTIQWERDHISTSIEHAQKTLQISRLLACQAERLSDEGQAAPALSACQAGLNAARSLGDEPSLIAQLMRCAARGGTLDALERVLAHGAPDPDTLAHLQKMLEQEDAAPILWIALRGERAGNHRVCQVIELGEMPLSKLIDGAATGGVEERFEGLIGREMVRLGHADCLRYYSKLLGIVQLPWHERQAGLTALNEEMGQSSVLVRMMMTALTKSLSIFQRQQARLRVALVALAVERYRRLHGHWPDSLDQLAPQLMAAISLDPYDGKPLRYRRLPDGVLVYSIGQDKVDDGGTIPRQGNPTDPGTDVGFQLWDVVKRRQPAVEN